MAFTQVSCTGTVMLSNATPANGAVVSLLLNTPITDGTQIVAPEPVTTRCASDGTFSVTVNANDDSTTLPTGSWYEVTITYGNQTLDSFNVSVPAADAPTVNLFSLAQLVNPTASFPFVQKIVAGTNVAISPTSGTGTVTINSSGGGASANVVNLGNITGTVTCNLASGTCFTGTLTGNVTINFSNWPASPALTEPLLILTQDGTGGHSITITGVVWEPAGAPPTFNTAAGNVNVIPLSSPDQGTHLYGSVGAQITFDTNASDFQMDGTAAAGSTGKAADAGHVHPTDTSRAPVLAPTAVKTSAYTATAGDFVPCDVSAGGFTVTLPTAPADKTQVEVKIVKQATAANTLTLATGGTDVFNVTGGATALALTALFEANTLQYKASTGIWYVLSTDTPVAPTGQEFINVLATPFSNVRWNTIAQSSADYFGGELQSDGTQNDEVVFQKYLQAGSYTMDLFYKTGATHGIFTIFVDGVQLGTTVDSWVASGGAMLRATIAGITVSGSTVHAIRLLMATKNASATSFFGIIGAIAMTRTGP